MTDHERVIETYGTTVYRVCFVRLRGIDPAAVEDAYQNVFLAYIEHPPAASPGSAAERAWFLRCAVNQCTDIIRTHTRHPSDELTDAVREEIPDENTGGVMEAITGLPDKYRMPIYLHYVCGYSTAECAAALGLRESAFRMRLTRARRVLAKVLEI